MVLYLTNFCVAIALHLYKHTLVIPMKMQEKIRELARELTGQLIYKEGK